MKNHDKLRQIATYSFLKCLSLFLFIIGFNANLHAEITYAQQKKLTVLLINRPVKDAFTAIEEQSEYIFVFEGDKIDLTRKVSVQLSNVTVDKILDQVFNGTDIEYIIRDRQIVIRNRKMVTKKTPASIVAPLASAIKKNISGTVKGTSGEPLIGVNILIKGTVLGATTDIHGHFTFADIFDNAVLEFSYIGYIAQSLSVANKTILNVFLQENSEVLSEVVVVGYGTQKKANLTGAIATVAKDAFKPRGISTATQYLQGMVANLNVISTDGGPGQDASFNIRGYSGLNSSNYPLVIVDGFVSSLKELNPNNIETVTVLKDAASAAIYGAQAAYGVILVTTKTGAKNAKPMVSYSNIFSYQSPVATPKTAGSIEFASLMREASLNEGGTGIFSVETLDRISQYAKNPGSIPNTIPQANNPNRWSNWGDGQCNANEDWFDQMFTPQVNQMHNISVAGGSVNSTYLMSIGVLRDEGKLRYFDDNYTKYNADLKLNTDITKWISIGMNLRYVKEVTVLPSYYFSSTVNSLFGWAAMMWPTQPVKDPNGHFTPDGRMAFIHQANPNTAMADKLSGAINTQLKITPDLIVNGGFNYNKYMFKQTSSKGLIYAWGVDDIPYLDGGSDPSNTQVWQASQNNDYISSNVFGTYSKSIGGHGVKLMVGTQMELQQTFTLNGNKLRLIFPTIPSIATAIGTPSVSDALDHWATLSYFGRFNYDYKNRYLLEFNIRRDGSSRYADESVLGSSGRWGTFPSLSVGWNVAKESFLAPIYDIVSELKLRGSYGELGNMRGKSYQYVSVIGYNPTSNYIMNGGQISAFGSPSMIAYNTWEKNRTLDFGLDFSILKNRLTGSFDWYRRDIIGLITRGEVLPAILGANSPDTNCADVRTSGIELSIGWKDQFQVAGKPFTYSVTALLSDYQGKVMKYSNPNKIFGAWDGGGLPKIWSQYYEGASMGEIWGFETGHIIKTQAEADEINASGSQSKWGGNWTIGDMKYKDINSDGRVTDGTLTLDDRGDLKVIGNSTPRYSYGLQVGAAWNNFDLSLLFQGVAKRDLWMNGTLTSGVGFYNTGSNVWESTLDCYRNDGGNPDPFWPKFYLNDHGRKNLRPQTKYLADASYCRLKNIRFGYFIPQHIVNKCEIGSLYFYVSADNILTFTSFNENMDPENPGDIVPWQSGDLPYPLSKSISIGLSLTF